MINDVMLCFDDDRVFFLALFFSQCLLSLYLSLHPYSYHPVATRNDDQIQALRNERKTDEKKLLSSVFWALTFLRLVQHDGHEPLV